MGSESAKFQAKELQKVAPSQDRLLRLPPFWIQVGAAPMSQAEAWLSRCSAGARQASESRMAPASQASSCFASVSYTHLTLPTNREV